MIKLKYQKLLRTRYFWLMFQVSMINVSTYLTISFSEIGKYQTSLSSFISFRLFPNQYPKLFPRRLAYDYKGWSWSLLLVLSEWFAHLILSFMYTSQIFWTLYIYSKPNAEGQSDADGWHQRADRHPKCGETGGRCDRQRPEDWTWYMKKTIL